MLDLTSISVRQLHMNNACNAQLKVLAISALLLQNPKEVNVTIRAL
jgi:hypothetical protein